MDKNQNRGFTLIEVIIALVLIGVLAISFSALFTLNLRGGRSSEETLKATERASSIIEYLKEDPSYLNQITTEETEVDDIFSDQIINDLPFPNNHIEDIIYKDVYEENIYRITVEVKWEERGERSWQLPTLIYQETDEDD